KSKRVAKPKKSCISSVLTGYAINTLVKLLNRGICFNLYNLYYSRDINIVYNQLEIDDIIKMLE
ncbi:MAG: hypothetical protein KAS39_03380, partial [Actinomycetia bacterium]|nr:hypothetical protein [Actinomycetes bacterium]